MGAFARAVTCAHLVKAVGFDDPNGLISIEREILIVCVFVTLSLYFSGISSNTEPVEKSVDQKLMNKTESNIAKTGNSDISTSY